MYTLIKKKDKSQHSKTGEDQRQKEHLKAAKAFPPSNVTLKGTIMRLTANIWTVNNAIIFEELFLI